LINADKLLTALYLNFFDAHTFKPHSAVHSTNIRGTVPEEHLFTFFCRTVWLARCGIHKYGEMIWAL
jgi:hypothetical protein